MSRHFLTVKLPRYGISIAGLSSCVFCMKVFRTEAGNNLQLFITKQPERSVMFQRYEIIKAENATLRAYNNMNQQYTEYKTVPAYIINRDISNLSDTMVINIGSDDGVTSNMPVVTSEGLVGYTISVTNKTAKVKPIIDASGSTSALISTSRESVVPRF